MSEVCGAIHPTVIDWSSGEPLRCGETKHGETGHSRYHRGKHIVWDGPVQNRLVIDLTEEQFDSLEFIDILTVSGQRIRVTPYGHIDVKGSSVIDW